jgi:signal transduction histidine kinase
MKESMHVIRVAGTLLQSKASDNDTRGIADFVVSASTDLHQMLLDLPDYARLEAGKETRTIGPVHVAALMRDVAEAVRPALQVKGGALRTDRVTALSVQGDFGKIRRIAENLVRYCLKHARPLEIELATQALPPDRWAFTVRSTGAPVENAPILPERISLSVARGFCSVLDGTFKTELASGCITFRVELPASYPVSGVATNA